jgi:hypothetical protein
MSGLPDYVTKYCWGDDLSELSWEKHRKYIVQTLLNKGDGRASGWLLDNVDKQVLKNELSTYKFDKRSVNFWKFYLS